MCAQEVFEIIFQTNSLLDLHAFETEFDVIHRGQIVRIDHGHNDASSGLGDGKHLALFSNFCRKQIEHIGFNSH